MTKTIRKLLGYLLIACLLLSGVSAMAETGKISFTVEKDAAKGFTDPDGIQFELYLVGRPVGTGSAWEATEDYPELDFPEVAPDANGKREYSAQQVEGMLSKIEAVLEGENAPAPIAAKSTQNGGKIEFELPEAGIYYIRKNADSRPKLLKVTPALIAVPAVGTATPYEVSVSAKRDYATPAKTSMPVKKIWQDDDNFDEIRPDKITVNLYRRLTDAGDRDPEFDKSVELSADNSWAYTWTDLDSTDENGAAYTYYVKEVSVDGYDTQIENGEITNRHTPDYGAIRVTKGVRVNGKTTGGTLADGKYNFTITGPSEAPNSKNYLNGVAFSITVKGGKSSTWSRDKLKPGTYVIKELTDSLPSGMAVVGSAEQTVTVEAGTTLSNPAEASFVNNQSVASLKITKTVTVNSRGTGGTLADGTYHFTVTGPSYPNGETVSIKIKNGRSASVQLDNLVPGEYEVKEIKTGLPASVSYVSGDNKKTLTVAHTADKPLTFQFINNRTVTPPPSESRPTPTPGYTPTPTPEVTPTPTPTPSPTPDIELHGTKVWRDEGNTHNTRPSSITVQLYQNGVQIRETKVSGEGNRWSYSFGTLPKVDENGAQYIYSVRESDVAGYTATVNGMTIVNDLIPQTPRVYTSFTGYKIWKDDDNESGDRPNYIIVRLMRDGHEVERRTVTGANGWQYTFQNVPVDDGYGNDYHYTVREDGVAGYVGRTDGFTLTNSRLPVREPEEQLSEFGMYGTPLAGFGEPELEGLLELFDYGTPLWGRPLKTGDEVPLYPIVFGGIGATALIALIVLIVIGKKRGSKAA